MVGGGEEWQKPQPLLRKMVALGFRELLLDSRAALCTWSHVFEVTCQEAESVWPQEVGEVSTAF